MIQAPPKLQLDATLSIRCFSRLWKLDGEHSESFHLDTYFILRLRHFVIFPPDKSSSAPLRLITQNRRQSLCYTCAVIRQMNMKILDKTLTQLCDPTFKVNHKHPGIHYHRGNQTAFFGKAFLPLTACDVLMSPFHVSLAELGQTLMSQLFVKRQIFPLFCYDSNSGYKPSRLPQITRLKMMK